MQPPYMILIQRLWTAQIGIAVFMVSLVGFIKLICDIIKFSAEASKPGLIQDTFISFIKKCAVTFSFLIGGFLIIVLYSLISLPSPNHLFECIMGIRNCPTIAPFATWLTIFSLVAASICGAMLTAWGIHSYIEKRFP